MAGALGKLTDKTILDLYFGGSGNVFLGLHTGNPGNGGQAGNEATGANLARATIAAGDWAAATNAEPSSKSNANQVLFGAAVADLGGGANITWVSFWTTVAGTAEAGFIGRLQISNPQPVLSGNIPFFDPNDLTITQD